MTNKRKRGMVKMSDRTCFTKDSSSRFKSDRDTERKIATDEKDLIRVVN